MKRLIVVLGSVAALAGAGAGCTELKACESNADCAGSGVCEPSMKICYVPEDAGGEKRDGGADSGVDAGPAVLCGAQGCPEWQTCKPTGPATGVCENVGIQPVAPDENSVLAGTARTPFKFQVTQWDGGVLERESIPVLTTAGGIAGPTTLSRSGNVFQADFTPANTGGRQSVTAGWAEVNSTITVNTEACDVSCAEWQECRPTQDGGTCVSIDVQLAFVQPVGVTVGRNSSVPIQASVSRPDGGSPPRSVPFRTSNGLIGVLEQSASFATSIDGGEIGGDIEVILGWEDGGRVVTGKYTVDLTPPSLVVTPAAAPVYPGYDGGFLPNDTTPAWRKDETIEVTVTSSSADIDPSSVVVTARHAGESALTLVGTPTDCGGIYCKVFSVDLSQVQMNAFADDVTLYATASDVRGNAMSLPANGAVRVTRWQWATRVSTTEALKASPAIDKNGRVFLGLAGTSTGGLVSVSSLGAAEPSSGDGPVEGSPAIGRNDAGVEYVFYQPSASAGTLMAKDVVQPCAGIGSDTKASKATPTVLYDGTENVMAVSLQGAPTGSRVVGLSPATGDCPHSTTAGLAPIASSPGNLVATGDSVFWGDSAGELHSASYSSPSFTVSGSVQVPASIGIMNGLLLFNPGTGMEIGGGGGGGPGIGRLFAFPISLSQASAWNPDYGPTPTSGPIVVADGVVAAIRGSDKIQVLRVNATTGQKAALTAALIGTQFEGTEVPTPVAGEGGLLYVLDGSGALVVLPQSFPDATASASWMAPAAVVGTTSASPTIDCNRRRPMTHTGILYFVTENGWLVSYIVDSKGLDMSAPWPKYAHDVRNTGNVGVQVEGCH